MKGHFLENNPCDSGQGVNVESFGCRRCGGLMQPESVFDVVENEIEFMAARCLQCGDIVDPVILMNRAGTGVLIRRSGRARH
jgi:uncharacterized Zn finger protein